MSTEEVILSAVAPSGNSTVTIPLLEVYEPEVLQKAIVSALPAHAPAEGDDNTVCIRADGDLLLVQLGFGDVVFLHALRDSILSGDFDAACTTALARVRRNEEKLAQLVPVEEPPPPPTPRNSSSSSSSSDGFAGGLLRGRAKSGAW